MSYRSLMLSDVPNAAMIFGYTNSSWTLKADISCEYLCRLMNHMDKSGVRQVTPRQRNPNAPSLPFLNMQSGYIQRAKHLFPKQGEEAPWATKQNYFFDLAQLRYTKIDDGVLEFRNPPAVKAVKTVKVSTDTAKPSSTTKRSKAATAKRAVKQA